MKKNLIKTILKFLFAFALIYWLTSSGRLDFQILAKALANPTFTCIGLLLLLCNFFIVTFRWKHILDLRSNGQLSSIQVLRANWIGMFFNSVLPGSVTGDFIKIFYIKGSSELSKRYLIGSILVDRFVGLFGLIFLVGFFSLFNYSLLSQKSSIVASLIHFNLLLFLLVILGFMSLYFFEELPKKMISAFAFKSTRLQKIANKILEIWELLCSMRSSLIFLTFISIIIQAIAVIAFWVVGSNYADGNYQLAQSFSYVPIGFVTIAIPISPSGLGVGHAVFDKLFELFHIHNGASLFNIYFFLQLFINILGIIPYLLHKGHHLPTEQEMKAD